MSKWTACFRAGVIVAAAINLTSAPTRAEGQEWTRFRGPNGTGMGVGPDIPVQFTPGDYNWRVELPGTGHSSPVLWGKKLFITSAEEDKGKRHLLCLNAADGKRIWTKTYDFKTFHHHEYNTSASSTPAVDGDAVYVTWSTPDSVAVLAFDHDGNELWKQDLGKLAIQHGAGMSPVVVGDVVVLGVYQEEEGPEGFLIGMNRKTGAKVWKIPRNRSGSAAYSTPALYTPKDGPPQLIFTSTSNGMTSVEPKTGAINWELPGLFTLRCNASPVIYGDLVFATAGVGGGEKQAFAVRPGSKEKHIDPKVEYKLARGPSNVPTPIVVGDLIFAWGDGGIVTCLKAGTGEQIWMDRVGGNFFGSPVCINGRLYAIDAKGEVVVIEASNQFKLLGKSDLGEPSNSTPAVAGGVLYLRTISHLISVGGKKHTTL